MKAFLNWCVARNLAASNPVRRLKLFHEDNSRLRYLSREYYDRLLKATRTIDTSPYLEKKIILAKGNVPLMTAHAERGVTEVE